MQQALQYLAQTQNRDGGFGYQSPGDSFTEPTALALMAMAGSDATSSVEAARTWLLKTQRRDGGWGAFGHDSESGWQTSAAIWALGVARKAGLPQLDVPIEGGGAWLLANRSRSLSLPNPATKLQGRLTGWPWTAGTFGWVIPTGLALLGLNASGQAAAAATAVSEAVGLLKDRRCSLGGWNWGNPLLFGAELPPYATETGVAVLGLLAAGEDASAPELTGALEWLVANLDPDTGVTATAWGLLALRAAGRDQPAAAGRLRAAQDEKGGWRGSPHATALATLALDAATR